MIRVQAPYTGRTLSLWHPFTARAVGWRESALRLSHIKPHVAALRHLAQERGIRPRVEYLTDSRLFHAARLDEISWRFWPRSLRAVRRFGRFRREWSMQGLLATALAPADLTIINTSGHGGPFARAIARVLRHRERPYVAMIGGLHVTTTGQQREYFAGAAAIAVHNTVVRQHLIDGGLTADRIVLVPLGIDTAVFSPDGADGQHAPKLLYVGRVARSKHLDRLIQALAAARRACPALTLSIVGPEADDECSASLRELINALSLRDHVEFAGPVRYDELPRYYRAASLFALPSDSEGFGMVVVESMACGTPVVALRGSGGPSDIITDGVDGRLVPAEGLAGAITELVTDGGRLRTMAGAARETVLARFGIRQTTCAFEELVQRALAA